MEGIPQKIASAPREELSSSLCVTCDVETASSRQLVLSAATANIIEYLNNLFIFIIAF
jgi:hypothetical protein